MPDKISDSRFNMWRAVVAMIHADEVIQPHEINFILTQTRDLPFSDEQRAILKNDLSVAGDVQALFGNITTPRDKEDFFHLARAVSWSDGDYDERERSTITHIGKLKAQLGHTQQESDKDFRDLYVDGSGEGGDNGLFAVIRGLIGRKKI